MGTLIQSTAVCTDPKLRGSIARSIAAGRECLAAVGLEGDDVDVLINVGVYRDSNMVEPAMAALIQCGVGMSLDYVRKPRAGLSFDLMNGACGLLNAVQVAGALLRTGSAQRVLVVSGDAHPSGRDDEAGDEFPYASMGGAMLLGRDERPEVGFGRVYLRDASGDAPGVEGFVDLPATGAHGREHVTVRRDPGADDALLDLATTTARECLVGEGVAAPTVLLASRFTADFGRRLAQRLHLDEATLVDLGDLARDPHTTALTLGYRRGLDSGRLAAGATVLMVVAGAGMTSAAAVYRVPPRP